MATTSDEDRENLSEISNDRRWTGDLEVRACFPDYRALSFDNKLLFEGGAVADSTGRPIHAEPSFTVTYWWKGMSHEPWSYPDSNRISGTITREIQPFDVLEAVPSHAPQNRIQRYLDIKDHLV
jgi:hypothetical protein